MSITKSKDEVVIVGAGPCGLGAAWRLKELGFRDYCVLEALDHPGGLASSYRDDRGFTWDVGGHVQFSHYADFDRVMDLALPDGWLEHQRESWVWIHNRFVAYPFQYNIGKLESSVSDACLKDLEKERATKHSESPKNFDEWMKRSFGRAMYELFMKPYNFKVWAYPPEMMSYKWIGERVALVDIDRLRENIRQDREDVSWGPNATFRFPKSGGTGAIWRSVANLIGEDKFRFTTKLVKIDPHKKELHLSDGQIISYGSLFSTLPLDKLMEACDLKIQAPLLSSNAHIVGIGLRGRLPENLRTKCWIYFPESNCPFYRVTVFSNYSPQNVPDAQSNWSLMCETSESPYKPVNRSQIVEETIQGLLNVGLIKDVSEVVSRWHFVAEPGYPTPSLNRDEVVDKALQDLSKFDIFSRGRFGVWRYEVSNQDHSFMQGVEWGDCYLNHEAKEYTFDQASVVNAPGKRPERPGIGE